MAVNISGDTGIDKITDGTIVGADIASTFDLTGKTVTLPSGTTGAGKILQVVSTTKTDTWSSTASSYTDITGMSASITPSSTSSKIYITASLAWCGQGTGSTGRGFRFVRGGTAICLPTSYGSREASTSADPTPDSAHKTQTMTMQFLDSPSTTSATTYKIQVLGNGSDIMYLNRSEYDGDHGGYTRATSTITIMEVAG